MLNLQFQNFRPIFLNVILFYLQHVFCSYDYLFEIVFTLLTFRDKWVRVLAGPFLRSKILSYSQNFQWVQNSMFPQWKTYFSQLIDKFLKFEEMESLVHHDKFEM